MKKHFYENQKIKYLRDLTTWSKNSFTFIPLQNLIGHICCPTKPDRSHLLTPDDAVQNLIDHNLIESVFRQTDKKK